MGLNYRLKINHPFREFFIGGAQGPCQKGRTLVLLKNPSSSLFPLIISLFLPNSLAHSLFFCTYLTMEEGAVRAPTQELGGIFKSIKVKKLDF